MLVNTRHVIGLPIYSIDEGKNIHKVEDVVYDPTVQRIQALIVDSGGLFTEGRAIAIDDVKNIGEDAVVIQTEKQLKKVSGLQPSAKRIASEDTFLTKSTVLTEDGKDLGKVVDLLFDPHTGQVEELEVSQGGIRDFQSGRKRVKPRHIITVGIDALIVSSFTEIVFEEQGQQGGVQGMFNQARRSTQEAADSVQEKWEAPETQSKINEAKTSIESAFESGKQKLQQAINQTQTQVNQTKNDPANQQKLEELRQKAAKTAQEVKMKAQQSAKGVEQELAGQKQRLDQEFMERKAEYESMQKDRAVGQYLTRNILDQQDQVIAHRGQMVTHSILNQAKRAGQLDSILQNVSPEPAPAAYMSQPTATYAGALGGEVERDEDAKEDKPPSQPT